MYIPYDARIVHVVVCIYQALNMYVKQVHWLYSHIFVTRHEKTVFMCT